MLESFARRSLAGSAMDLVPPACAQRTLARLLVGLLVLAAAVLTLTPWQQTSPGTGRVIAYVPEERQQNLEAPIEGRVSGVVDIPNACCSLYLPTAIFDFDVRPNKEGPVSADRGSCARTS